MRPSYVFQTESTNAMSDSDSDIGPSSRPQQHTLAAMASQFLGTGRNNNNNNAAESIFIGQPSSSSAHNSAGRTDAGAHSGMTETSDYGLGALDPFALDEEEAVGDAHGERKDHPGWHQQQQPRGPAVIPTTVEESHYGFQSEQISDEESEPMMSKAGRSSAPERPSKQQQQHQQPQHQHDNMRPQDTHWLAAFLVCLLISLAIWLWSYLFANAPYQISSGSSSSPQQGDTETQEAQSILSILPMLTSFTLVSIASSMGVMFLLSQAVRKMVWALLVAGPALLVSAAFWGWGMSFSSMTSQGGETRWACFFSLLLAGISGRMIYTRIQRIDKTIRVIEVCSPLPSDLSLTTDTSYMYAQLATTALLAHPALFGLQAVLLLAHLVLTIPFFSLFCRLLLLHPTNPNSPVTWMSVHVLLTYLWALALFRNAAKLTASIALSDWYFSRHEPDRPHGATSVDLVRSAFDRARGPQAGTVALSSLILTLTEVSAFALVRMREALRKARGTGSLLASFECVAPAIVFLCGVAENISGYAIIWCGITGVGFWASSRRVTGLIRSNGMGRTADCKCAFACFDVPPVLTQVL